MTQYPKARIIGLGSYLPEHILSNVDFEKMVDTTDEWIVTRTGIKERRIAAENEFTSDMGVEAAKKALQQANVAPESIDLIIVATMSPDYIAPATAALIQDKLKAKKAAALDIQAACSGYIYGLSLAKAYIESSLYNTVLLVASEKMSAFVDYQDRSTCVLFGDGATAAIITGQGSGLNIEAITLGAEGKHFDLAIVPAGGSKHPPSEQTVKDRLHYFQMDGKEVFKHAVRRMEQAARECLSKAGVEEEEISWLIPHQANARILEALKKHFNPPIYSTVQKYGNTSASSIGIALDELIQENPLSEGDKLLLVAFGVGFTWGAALLTKKL